jgi:hypothetical protein
MQRQVYSQPARNVEELRSRRVRPIHSGHIWDGADQIGWIENGSVFSVATKKKFAQLDDDGNLYDLNGQSLNLSLQQVNGGGRLGPDSHVHAVVRFKELADG